MRGYPAFSLLLYPKKGILADVLTSIPSVDGEEILRRQEIISRGRTCGGLRRPLWHLAATHTPGELIMICDYHTIGLVKLIPWVIILSMTYQRKFESQNSVLRIFGMSQHRDVTAKGCQSKGTSKQRDVKKVGCQSKGVSKHTDFKAMGCRSKGTSKQ